MPLSASRYRVAILASGGVAAATYVVLWFIDPAKALFPAMFLWVSLFFSILSFKDVGLRQVVKNAPWISMMSSVAFFLLFFVSQTGWRDAIGIAPIVFGFVALYVAMQRIVQPKLEKCYSFKRNNDDRTKS